MLKLYVVIIQRALLTYASPLINWHLSLGRMLAVEQTGARLPTRTIWVHCMLGNENLSAWAPWWLRFHVRYLQHCTAPKGGRTTETCSRNCNSNLTVFREFSWLRKGSLDAIHPTNKTKKKALIKAVLPYLLLYVAFVDSHTILIQGATEQMGFF